MITSKVFFVVHAVVHGDSAEDCRNQANLLKQELQKTLDFHPEVIYVGVDTVEPVKA